MMANRLPCLLALPCGSAGALHADMHYFLRSHIFTRKKSLQFASFGGRAVALTHPAGQGGAAGRITMLLPWAAISLLALPTESPFAEETSTTRRTSSRPRMRRRIRDGRQPDGRRRAAHEARPVSLYSWAQLERHSEHGLSRIGERRRDALGPSSVAPPYPQYHQKEQIITWVLERQVELARSTGLDVSLKSFGVPPPGM